MSTGTRRRLAAAAQAFSATAHNPSLARAQLAFAATWTGEWAFTVAIAVVAFRDGGASAVGIVAFVRMAPAAVLAPLGIAVADRFPRDRVLIWTCLARAVTIAAAAAVLAADGSNVAVYALAAIATAAFTMFRPAHSALLPALSRTPLELTSANVVRALADSVSTLLGPLLAALLLGTGTPTAVFAATAVLSLASGGLLLALSYQPPPARPPPPMRRIGTDTIDGFRALVRYRDVGLLVALGKAQTLTRGFLNVFLVVIALELLEMQSSGVGVLTAAVGAGAVVSSLAAAMFVTGRRLATLEGVGVALWGLPLTLSGALPYEPVVLALMCVIGVGNTFVDIGLFTLASRLVPNEDLARVFGAQESLVALTVAFGSLITPLATELLGIRGALIVLGLIGPACVLVARRRLQAIDASVERRDEEVEVLNKVAIFRPLPMPAVDSLALRVAHADVPAGREVFHQGDHGDRFYVIADGEAEVIGDDRLLRTLGPGDGFGEIALLRDTPRTTTVRVRTPLRLFALERQDFLATVTGYQSSTAQADTMVRERLATFDPGRRPAS